MNNQLQTLLHDALTATGHCENCALFRRKDVSLRAYSPGFTLNNEEMENLCDLFSDCDETRRTGVNLKGVHYKAIRADRFSIYGKQDKEGIIIVRTATFLIVATYSQEMYASVCVESIEKLGDYFREKGR